MSTERANWDDRTCVLFLDLINQQKTLCHWGSNSPTSIGWTNILHAFENATRLGYDKKQLENKWNELKRVYFNWRNGQTHTRLGHDPQTGEVTADPGLFAADTGVLTTPFSLIIF